MAEGRRAGRRVTKILGCAAVLAAIVMGVKYGFPGAKPGGPGAAGSTGGSLDDKSPLAALGEAARSSDPRVLAEIQRRLTAPTVPGRPTPTRRRRIGSWS